MSDRLQPDKKRGGGTTGHSSSPVPPVEAPTDPPAAVRRMVRPRPAPGAGPTYAATDLVVSGFYPALVEYLTRRVVDGQQIQTATLLLFAEEGSWKVCLNDRASELVAFRAGQTVQEALDSLEAALADNSLDWRGRRGSGRR